jgi:large subunit ribosomal protein L25
VSRSILHADFLTIDDSKKVVVEVPFKTKGKSKGEGSGGTLLVNLRELKVRCQAASIPVAIEYDVTDLQIDDIVKVKDLTLPEGSEPITPPDRKVITVKPPRVMAAADTAAEGEEAAEGDTAGAAEGDES